MTISVIITTYNRAALLERTLASIRRQQFEPGDELVVVDNASTDTTPAVIEAAKSSFPVGVTHLRETTPGKTPALNTGIAAARGEVLALTDDDVLVADDWIATIRALFSDAGRALVGGRVDPLWHGPTPRWLRVEEGGQYSQMAAPLALLHYGAAQDLQQRTAVGANLVVRRSVHDAVGGFTPHLGRRRGTLLCGEDHDFCARVGAAGYRCEYRPEVRVQHYVPTARTTLRYYLRWFIWSGITHAMLATSGAAGATDPLFAHSVRRLAVAPLKALRHLAAARYPEAAEEMMEAAFAGGYLTRRILAGRKPAWAGQHAVRKPDSARALSRAGVFHDS